MTNEDKKKKLKAYIFAGEKISDLIEEIEVLKAKALKVTPTLSDMPKGSGTSDKSGVIDIYLDMIHELECEARTLSDTKREVEHLISTIDDWTVERIMRLRYIDGLKWEEICVRANYGWTQVHKFHSDGLNSIEVE